MSKKLLIIGHARHGKDTLAEIWSQVFRFKFTSSSMKAAEIFIYNALKPKYGYTSFEECYEDRKNHRAEWYELIKSYNEKDRTKLAVEILKDNDCYVGMREREEILACDKRALFDLKIWVDASERLPLESVSSFNIDRQLSDIVIDNNDSIDSFTLRAVKLGNLLLGYRNSYRVGYDVDGVLAEFSDHFLNWFDFEDKSAPTDWDDPRFRDNFHKIANDDKFWLTIPPLITAEDLPHIPSVYITARPISTDITQKWLEINGFPKAPIVTVGMDNSKVEVAKAFNLHCFLDDAIHNYIDMNSAGITTYLVSRSHNEKFNVNKRLNKISSLNEHIKN